MLPNGSRGEHLSILFIGLRVTVGVLAPGHISDLSPVLGTTHLPGVPYSTPQLGALPMEQRMVLVREL
jgi:hypothetical protein